MLSMKNNYISPSIPLDKDEVLDAIAYRQGLPWNNGRISEYCSPPVLNRLFQIINSGIPKEDFFYEGDLYRIHAPYSGLADRIDKKTEFVASKVCSDNSCAILFIQIILVSSFHLVKVMILRTTEYFTKLSTLKKHALYTKAHV